MYGARSTERVTGCNGNEASAILQQPNSSADNENTKRYYAHRFINSKTCSGEKVVSANALARAGSSAFRAAASSSSFSGDAATALIRNSGLSVTLAVDKSASARYAGIVTPRVDRLAICNQTDPSTARHVATVRATTTRSKVWNFSFQCFRRIRIEIPYKVLIRRQYQPEVLYR